MRNSRAFSKWRHNNEINSECQQGKNSSEDKQIDEAAGSQANEEHDDKRDDDGDREGKDNDEVVFHQGSYHLSRSANSWGDFSLN